MKRVTQALRDHGYGHYVDRAREQMPVLEASRVVEKPWGREVWWAETDRYLGKVLEVRPGQALSSQYHETKHETMLVVQGDGILTLDGVEIALTPGVRVPIAPGNVHRLVAGRDGIMVVEVSTAYPDDVVRVEDRYGRAEPGTLASGR
jgi:mannose-6-phosphate isomerase-like protein (cupin superfamily)